jgi:hypothetical protein
MLTEEEEKIIPGLRFIGCSLPFKITSTETTPKLYAEVKQRYASGMGRDIGLQGEMHVHCFPGSILPNLCKFTQACPWHIGQPTATGNIVQVQKATQAWLLVYLSRKPACKLCQSSGQTKALLSTGYFHPIL